jgi:hypothetical protein
MQSWRYPVSVLFALLAVFWAVGCSKIGTRSLAPDTDTEAKEFANRFWAKTLLKCGDSYYFLYNHGAVCRDQCGTGGRIGRVEISEYRDVSFTLRNTRLSEADTLNGFEWNGKSQLCAKAARVFSPAEAGQSQSPAWQPGAWMGGVGCPLPISVYLYKSNGRWYYADFGDALHDIKINDAAPPDLLGGATCAALPRVQSDGLWR